MWAWDVRKELCPASISSPPVGVPRMLQQCGNTLHPITPEALYPQSALVSKTDNLTVLNLFKGFLGSWKDWEDEKLIISAPLKLCGVEQKTHGWGRKYLGLKLRRVTRHTSEIDQLKVTSCWKKKIAPLWWVKFLVGNIENVILHILQMGWYWTVISGKKWGKLIWSLNTNMIVFLLDERVGNWLWVWSCDYH